jgi:SAM-dependent methyltransferase
MKNTEVYPLKYANMVVDSKAGTILEAGCGNGRILRYYHDKGYDIIGIDFIPVAIQKLKETDASLKVAVGDITSLDFADGTFKTVLAFGLYHNLEHGLEKSVKETYRVLETGGKVCASFRADNFQTRVTDWLANRKQKSQGLEFHKLNLTTVEFRNLFEAQGFKIEKIMPVSNMPFLYKFRIFRSADQKVFDENKARKDGYRFSALGGILHKFLIGTFPNQFCNIYVLVGVK